jgi:hypothetical protein
MMFTGNTSQQLKSTFKSHFKNITRIMDCVGCSKCKLWGKLQVHGIGTALKILFSEKKVERLNSQEEKLLLSSMFWEGECGNDGACVINFDTMYVH